MRPSILISLAVVLGWGCGGTGIGQSNNNDNANANDNGNLNGNDNGNWNWNDNGNSNGNSSGVCGDGVTDPGEGCDDGNPHSGDGCSGECAVEHAAWLENPVLGDPGPSARRGHGLAYDATRGVAVMFGGWDGTNDPLAETWEFDGSEWRQLTLPGAPPARALHGMVYDQSRDVVVTSTRGRLRYHRCRECGARFKSWEGIE